MRARLVPAMETQEITVQAALEQYEEAMKKKGNKPTSIATTLFRLRRFFYLPEFPLRRLTATWCAKRYAELCEGQAVDTHRNTLAEARTWLRWCVAKPRCWLRGMPLAEVQGEGRRRHGKPQLRITEARKWLDKAYELAEAGDEGALAALLTLELGLRAGEIVTRRVRDIDDEGRVLWVDAVEEDGWTPKTEAGQRQQPVPEELRRLLVDQTHGKLPTAWLFPSARGHRGRHDRAWPQAQVRRICEAAGVPMVCAHAQRGLRSTLDVLGGLSLADSGRLLGHADHGRTAQRSYASAGAVEFAKQERVSKVLRGGRGSMR